MWVLGAHYAAGAEGVTIAWADGSITRLAPWQRVRFKQQPKHVTGRLWPLGKNGRITYEAPELRAT